MSKRPKIVYRITYRDREALILARTRGSAARRAFKLWAIPMPKTVGGWWKGVKCVPASKLQESATTTAEGA